mmetsp:Transcript_23241/g.88038  ORF Transcript_23241/g.88038 Transcript_23241/m.88038 type:complete len:321 (-) Transcript_23241:149-1111(-)
MAAASKGAITGTGAPAGGSRGAARSQGDAGSRWSGSGQSASSASSQGWWRSLREAPLTGSACAATADDHSASTRSLASPSQPLPGSKRCLGRGCGCVSMGAGGHWCLQCASTPGCTTAVRSSSAPGGARPRAGAWPPHPATRFDESCPPGRGLTQASMIAQPPRSPAPLSTPYRPRTASHSALARQSRTPSTESSRRSCSQSSGVLLVGTTTTARTGSGCLATRLSSAHAAAPPPHTNKAPPLWSVASSAHATGRSASGKKAARVGSLAAASLSDSATRPRTQMPGSERACHLKASAIVPEASATKAWRTSRRRTIASTD